MTGQNRILAIVWSSLLIDLSFCRYDEWYTRALMPGVTHIDVPDDESMCNATWQKVRVGSIIHRLLQRC